MKDKRVLIISPEVVPYLPQSELAINSFKIPKSINDSGGQIRIFMPRYGLINERRHQLHEVIRLSGMNLVINDMDTPLIIKVASIPKERMQVYFIDNEDYFKRRAVLRDGKGKLFKDNDERMIFFTKGVIETVKKLNWSPDIIHLQGWFTYLFPLYLKTYFNDDPIFSNSKIVSSIYPKDFEGVLSKKFKQKVEFDGIPENLISDLVKSDFVNLSKLCIAHADGFVLHGKASMEKEVIKEIENSNKPFVSNENGDEEIPYVNFYTKYFS
tara:strand:- start:715 stop:1521 length:807 start_codon:yes stop_codon:yes gene_type:complete